MQYGGPGISELGRDGLVNSEDHFVFFTVGAKPAGFKSTIFLGTSPTFLYTRFSHVCVYSHDGEICTFLNVGHHLQHAASLSFPSLQSLPSRTSSGDKRSKHPRCHGIGPVTPPLGPSASLSKR